MAPSPPSTTNTVVNNFRELQTNCAEDDPKVRRLRTFGRSLIKTSVQPVVDLSEFQQSALKGTFKLTELRVSRAFHNESQPGHRHLSKLPLPFALTRDKAAQDTLTPIKELKNTNCQKASRMVEFVHESLLSDANDDSGMDLRRTVNNNNATQRCSHSSKFNVPESQHNEIPLLVNVHSASECNVSSTSDQDESESLNYNQVQHSHYRQEPEHVQCNDGMRWGVNGSATSRVRFAPREFTEAEIRRIPSLRNLNVIRGKVQMARDVMAQSVESTPFPHIRTAEERLQQVLHDEHAKIIMLTGRVHNLEEKATEMVDAIAQHKEESNKENMSTADKATGLNGNKAEKKMPESFAQEHSEMGEGNKKHDELIKFLAPSETNPLLLSRTSSASSLARSVILPEDAIRQIRQLVHNFLSYNRRSKPDRLKRKSASSRSRHRARRSLAYSCLGESENDHFAISRLRALIEQFDENIHVLEDHYGNAIAQHEGASVRRRDELVAREPNAKDIGWILETLDMALLTDIHTLVNAEDNDNVIAANNNSKCPLPVVLSSSTTSANKNEIRRMLKERLKLSRTRRALSAREFAHSTLSSSWNSARSQRMEMTQSSDRYFVSPPMMHKPHEEDVQVEKEMPSGSDQSLVPFSYHSFPSGNSFGLDGELGNLNVVNFMFEAIVDELLRQEEERQGQTWKESKPFASSLHGSQLRYSIRSQNNSHDQERIEGNTINNHHIDNEKMDVTDSMKDAIMRVKTRTKHLDEHPHRKHHHHHNKNGNRRAITAPAINELESNQQREKLPSNLYDSRKWISPAVFSEKLEEEEQELTRSIKKREKVEQGSHYRYADGESNSSEVDQSLSSYSSSRLLESSSSFLSSSLSQHEESNEEEDVLLYDYTHSSKRFRNIDENDDKDKMELLNSTEWEHIATLDNDDNANKAGNAVRRIRIVSLRDSYLNELRKMYKLYDYHHMINEHREKVHISKERTEEDYIAEMEAMVAKHRQRSAEAASRHNQRGSTDDLRWNRNSSGSEFDDEDDIERLSLHELRKRLSSNDRSGIRSSGSMTSSQNAFLGKIPQPSSSSRSSQRSELSPLPSSIKKVTLMSDKESSASSRIAEDVNTESASEKNTTAIIIFTEKLPCGVVFTLTRVQDEQEKVRITSSTDNNNIKDIVNDYGGDVVAESMQNTKNNNKESNARADEKDTVVRSSVNSGDVLAASSSKSKQLVVRYVLSVTNSNHDKSCTATVHLSKHKLRNVLEITINNQWASKPHANQEKEQQLKKGPKKDDAATTTTIKETEETVLELELSPDSAIELLSFTATSKLEPKQRGKQLKLHKEQEKTYKRAFRFAARELTGFDPFTSLHPMTREQADIMSLASNDDEDNDDDDDEVDKTAVEKQSKTKKVKSTKKPKKATQPSSASATATAAENKRSLPVKSESSTAMTTTKQDMKNKSDNRDVSEWGSTPSDRYANVIEKNIIALSALRMDAADNANRTDDVNTENKKCYSFPDAREESASKTVTDWTTANYSATLPDKVDNTFVFHDTPKKNNDNVNNISLHRDNESVMNRSERNSRMSNVSDSKTFHVDTAPGSPERSVNNLLVSSTESENATSVQRIVSASLPPLGLLSAASLTSKLGRPMSSQSSHSSRPTSTLGMSSHRKLTSTPPTPPMIIASTSSHPLLTTDLADSLGKRGGMVKYDEEDDEYNVDTINVEPCLAEPMSSTRAPSRPTSGLSDKLTTTKVKDDEAQVSSKIIEQLQLAERNDDDTRLLQTKQSVKSGKVDMTSAHHQVTSAAQRQRAEKNISKYTSANVNVPLPTIVYDVDEEQVQLDKFASMTLPHVSIKRSKETGKVNVLLPADASVSDTLRHLPFVKTHKKTRPNVNVTSQVSSQQSVVEPTVKNAMETESTNTNATKQDISAVQASTFLKKIAKEASNDWQIKSQESKLVSVNNIRQNASISSRQFKSEMDQLEDEARELYLIDPIRYDAVIDDLLNFALERVNSATATRNESSTNAEIKSSDVDRITSSSTLETRTQEEVAMRESTEKTAEIVAASSVKKASFTHEKETDVNAVIVPEPMYVKLLSQDSITKRKSLVKIQEDTKEANNKVKQTEKVDENVEETSPLQQQHHRRRRSTVMMEKLQMSKQGENTSAHVLDEGKKEIQRILYDQMKAKLILRFMIAQMKALWAQKKRACDEKTRENVSAALHTTLQASWQVERKRVINLNKLIHILDRRSRRNCHGWIPFYSDDNVLMNVYVDTNSGASDHEVCRRFTKLHAQRKILHAACLAKRRKLLPMHLLRREVQDSYNYHLLYGYRTQTITLSELVAPGEDVHAYRTYIDKPHPLTSTNKSSTTEISNNGASGRRLRNKVKCNKSYLPPSIVYLCTTADRLRYRRRLQYTAAFQNISTKYSPRRRRDMDLPRTNL